MSPNSPYETLTKTNRRNIITLIFLLLNQSKKNSQEDETEVLPEEEATSTKPAPGGTENPLGTLNSTHCNQNKAQPYPRNYYCI